MKRLSLWLIVFAFLGGFALSVRAQAGRVRTETRTPAEMGPFSEPLNKPPETVALPEIVDGERIYKLKEVDSRPIVTKKPAAVFIREARKRLIEGTVVLRVIFTATGEVKNPMLISGLAYGLTESAIKAAHKIKFRPAIKDGKAVSMWVRLEYTFSLY
ncbi:MAG: oligo,6-glucosidase [Blastocatellia bacterium]|nr:oligo,6-glucosidase [Blastocatellia bacterium]